MKIAVYAISKNEAQFVERFCESAADADLTTSGIYAITHIATGRAYVGKSANIKRRWKEHIRDMKTDKYKTEIYNSLRKYGPEAFDWEILELCSVHHLDCREMWWIIAMSAFDTGFNHTIGGDGLRAGSKHSFEANYAKSLRQKGKPHSPEHIAAVASANKGVPRNTSQMVAANIGRPRFFSEEHRLKISESKKGKPMPFGAVQKAWMTRKENQLAKNGEYL